MKTYNRLMAATAMCAVGAIAGAAHAQSPEPAARCADDGAIAEIVVTARKREESAQSVPLAITNFDAEQLAEKGVAEVEDLSNYVPGLVFRSSQSNTSARFSLRGQVSGDQLLTIAPAVGVYVDSGNVPHPFGLNGAIFDIERVEVLKGPQGTLYGRNTTGGAVNFITKGADFAGEHGYVSLEVGDYDARKLGAAFNFVLAEDVLAVRVAGQYSAREGYGESLVTGQRYGGDRDDEAYRGSLLFTPNSSVVSVTKLEYVNLNRGGFFNRLVAVPANGNSITEIGLEAGCATSIGNITPSSPTFNLATARAFSGCTTTALNAAMNTGGLFKNNTNAISSEKVETWHAVEDLTIDINDDLRLRSITAYHKATLFQAYDFDGSPFQVLEFYTGVGGIQPDVRYVSDGVNPIPGGTSVLPAGTRVGFPYQFPLPFEPAQAYYQWSQEFNLSGSAFDDRLDWLAGAFGSYDEGHGTEPNLAFPALTGGSVSATSNTPSIVNKSWGLYSQSDFRFSGKWSVTAGLRYSKDYQDIESQPYSWSAVTNAFRCIGVPPAPNTAAPGNSPDACPIIKNGIEADGWSYLASVNFQATPDILVYAKTSRGFRGGSLQMRTAYLPGSEPEIATDYELGFKGDFFERRLRVNLAAYHTKLENKQESQAVPVCGDQTNPACFATQTIILNAAEARVNGLEAEVTAVPVRGLTLNATYGLADSKYTSWPNAPDQNTSGGTFDATGLPFREPKWTYTLGGRYERDFGPGVASASLTWAWQDDTPVTRLQYPLDGSFPVDMIKKINEARGLLSGRIDYALEDKGVVLAISGTNLLNKKYETIDTFSKSLGLGVVRTAEPRMVAISITKTFGAE